MAAMAQMQNALRAEIRDLKLKIVSLETAEVDNLRLRKELLSIKTTSENEKEKLEAYFLNQLTDVERDSNARVADIEGNLKEKQRECEQLKEKKSSKESPKSVNGRIEAMELNHQLEIAKINDQKRHEVDLLQNQLRVVQTKRDDLTRKLEEAVVELELNDRHRDSLGNRASPDGRNFESDRSRNADRLLREANEEIRRLKADAIEQSSSSIGQPQIQLQKKVQQLERENLRLNDAAKQADENRKKHEITILQLERRNHDLKMSLQKLEIKGRNENLDTRASYGFMKEGDLEFECRRLQSELRETKSALKLSNLKKEELGYELRKASTANALECSPGVDVLQQRNQSLQAACKQFESELDELKGQLQKSSEENTSLLEQISGVKSLLKSTEDEKQKLSEKLRQTEIEIQQKEPVVDTPRKRTSKMIRQMEQNLKREKLNTDNITAKFRKERESDREESKEKDSNSEMVTNLRDKNRKLNIDVNQLQHKLECERKLSRSLRSEIGDMRASNATEGKFGRKDRESFSSNRSPKESGRAASRNSVRGIAARFENGGLQTEPEEKPAPRASFSKKLTETSDEVKGLKRDLQIERKQVTELEEELSRQCEINGSLLKEIKDLALEMEAKRLENARNFKDSLKSQKDEEEMNNLRSQIKELVQDLADASRKKDVLEAKLQDQVKDFDKKHSEDEETIDRLEDKLQSLNKELANTRLVVKDLRGTLDSVEKTSSEQQMDIQRTRGALHDKDSKLSVNEMSGFREQEIEQLQIEVTQLRQKLIESNSDRQIAEAKLKKYFDERGASSKSVQILRDRNAALKFEVEKLTKQLSKIKENESLQVRRVMI